MGYIFAISVAVFVFPIAAFLFTVPYILSQYHKYGSISFYRSIIIYSFIFYMLVIYFLVILPLPDIADVGTDRFINLRAFDFVRKFIKESVFVVDNPSTYIPAMKQPCFYIVVFNVFMTMPFGIYMRYYFKCGFIKTVLLTLALSAFFEFTQYTGIYFIYPGSYRMCDVDDLIQNTTGGVLGFWVAGLAMKLLPSRERIDQRAYERGQTISGFRRLLMFIIDMIVLIIGSNVIYVITDFKYSYIVLFAVLYLIIPLIFKGRTIGSWIVSMKMEAPDKLRFRIIIRHFFIIIYYNLIPAGIIFLTAYEGKKRDVPLEKLAMIIMVIGMIMVVFYGIQAIIVWLSNKVFYDRWMKISFVSTVRQKNTILGNVAEETVVTDSILPASENSDNFAFDEEK
ncbi:MAG: VanZ family protein [Coprococcus sp.]